jgi:hypothetical protein
LQNKAHVGALLVRVQLVLRFFKNWCLKGQKTKEKRPRKVLRCIDMSAWDNRASSGDYVVVVIPQGLQT